MKSIFSIAPGIVFACSLGASPAYAAAGPVVTPFKPGAVTLPRGYRGLDPGTLFRAFLQGADVPSGFEILSKVKRPTLIQKGEFEKSEEFSARKAKLLAAALPPGSSHALASDNAQFTYNADSGIMDVKIDAISDSGRGYVKLATLYQKTSSYAGVNSFGARTTVSKRDVEQLFAGAKESSLFHRTLYEKSFSSRFGSYKLAIPVAAEEAKRWKAKDVSVLFVGHVDGDTLTQVLFRYDKPTISDPTEFFSVSWGIPFEIDALYVYLRGTGEIVLKKEFKTDPAVPEGGPAVVPSS